MTLRWLGAKNVGEVAVDVIGHVLGGSRVNDENLGVEFVSVPVLFAEISSALVNERRNDLRHRTGSLTDFDNGKAQNVKLFIGGTEAITFLSEDSETRLCGWVKTEDSEVLHLRMNPWWGWLRSTPFRSEVRA